MSSSSQEQAPVPLPLAGLILVGILVGLTGYVVLVKDGSPLAAAIITGTAVVFAAAFIMVYNYAGKRWL